MSIEDWQTKPVNEMSTNTLALRASLFAHMCADAKRVHGSESEKYIELSTVLDLTFNELHSRKVEDIANAWEAVIKLGMIDYDKLCDIYRTMKEKHES